MIGSALCKLSLAIVLGATAFVIGREAASAADPVVTDFRVDAPQRVTVGDHLRYVITVEADRGTNVTLAPGGLPDELALTQSPKSSTRSKGERVEITLTLEVAPFVAGDLTVPPLKLRYRSGGVNGEIETPPSRLNVSSILTQNDLDPRDLKPQAEIGTPPIGWLLPAIAAAAVALAVVIGLLIWRRRVLSRQVDAPVAEPEVVPRGPEDRARAVLDKAGRDFLVDQDYAVYYTAIAVTARDYLTERFGFPAFALTTAELQEQMIRRGVERWQARITAGLLTQCDAVVYAGYRPAAERADADLTAAYEIIEMSRPAPVEYQAQVITV